MTDYKPILVTSYVNPDLDLVDTSRPHDIDSSIDPRKVDEIIDHWSVVETGAFVNARLQIELVASCATLIAYSPELIMRKQISAKLKEELEK